MISYIIPTRNRHDALAETLGAIQTLYADQPALRDAAEVVIIDNASDPPVAPPRRRPHTLFHRLIRLEENRAAAARNAGAKAARFEWLVMLDDDSAPLDLGVHRLAVAAPSDTAAIGAKILLPNGGHEAGGLPEVFIGCGAAIRRDVFAQLGGYDASFGYYVEEYDLAARILLSGRRIVHHAGWRVLHRKLDGGRNMDVILRNLVRNNAWLNARYTPEAHREARHLELLDRYGRIADLEQARAGYELGVEQMKATLTVQPRTPMPADLFDRFTGLESARRTLDAALTPIGARTAHIVHRGKNAWAVEQAIGELGVQLVDDPTTADARVIGTLSPGSILDALRLEAARPGSPVAAPYHMAGSGAPDADALTARPHRSRAA